MQGWCYDGICASTHFSFVSTGDCYAESCAPCLQFPGLFLFLVKYHQHQTEIIEQQMAKEYRDRIKANIPAGHFFEPLMTIYLTSRTTPEDIYEVNLNFYYPYKLLKERTGWRSKLNLDPLIVINNSQASKEGIVKAVKWYPAGATTNSDFGTEDYFSPFYTTHSFVILVWHKVSRKPIWRLYVLLFSRW